jgi:hypothetical protein
VDLAGQARVVDGDGDGSKTVDIGAYEFCPSGGCAPETVSTQVSALTAETAATAVTLRWETRREVDLAGFAVYRTPVSGGESVRITETPLPATGGAEIGASYRLTDQPGAGTFVYELELVQQDAQTLRQGQVEVAVEQGQPASHQLHLPLLSAH